MSALLVALWSSSSFAQDYQPKVAVVGCGDTDAWSWEAAQASRQATVGLANLAGIPYDTVTLAELLAQSPSSYSGVWFSSCLVLTDENHAAVAAFLIDFTNAGGNVFLDGPLGSFRPDPAAEWGVSYRGMSELGVTINVIDAGWFSAHDYRVTTAAVDHPIATTMGIAQGTEITQGIIEGTEILELARPLDPYGAVLLELTAPTGSDSYPFLIATQTAGGGKVLAIATFGSYVAPATSFRNGAPAGFFDNRLLPYLVEGLLWMEGPDDLPSVGLQLSHADMTAIGRVDADWSGETDASEATLLYVLEAARTTGLATAYGVVTGLVTDAGWQILRDGGVQLEDYGGAMVSHSHTHNFEMSETLDASGWRIEVEDSMALLRSQLAGPDFAPAVHTFINPGGTIEASDYGRFFDAVELFMSHGSETATPYSSGVMGFGLAPGTTAKPVVNVAPVADVQWLYDDNWVYTVQQAASMQAQILDYYQHTVGRGVLYCQMWHDYAIGGNLAPNHDSNADSVLPLFDANLEHFAAEEVYMPSVDELVAKLNLAHKTVHSTTVDGDTLTTTLDLSAVPARYRFGLAGMGLRVNQGLSAIRSVTIDGIASYAFSRDTVYLPAASGDTQTVVVELGAAPAHPHLAFASKPVDTVTLDAEALSVAWEQDGQHRKLCIQGPAETVVLHADRFDRQGSARLCAQMGPSSTTTEISTVAVDSGDLGFFVDSATVPIDAARIEGRLVTLSRSSGLTAGELITRSAVMPLSVRIDGRDVDFDYEPRTSSVDVPAEARRVEFLLDDCEDVDNDGYSACNGDCDDTDPETGLCSSGCGCRANGGGGGAGLGGILCILVLFRRRRGR